jgi:hypothetical protein
MRKLSFSQMRRMRREDGSIAVEFAIIFPILMLLIFGVIDFGHAWYMRHLMSDASREGARYGSRYMTDSSSNRILPKNLSPTVANYILQTSAQNSGTGGYGLNSLLPSDAHPTVIVGGAASTEASSTNLAGEDLTITINATKTWFVLGSIIPGLGSTKNLSVATTMRCE